MNKRKNIIIIWLAICICIFTTMACGSSTTEKLQEAQSDNKITQSEEEQVTESESTPTKQIVVNPLVLSKYGFGQDGNSAGYAFILENPNAGLSINNSQYQVAAYDDSNTVIDTDSGYIDIILPNQSLGISGELYVDDGKVISKIEIQIKDGRSEATDAIQFFTVQNVTFLDDEYFAHVTGTITSPFNKDITSLKTSAILYDGAGNIIGGGHTYVNFLLANTSTGVEVSVTSNGDVANVELYPSLSGLSFLSSTDNIPDSAVTPSIVNIGFGQGTYDSGFGIIFQNANSKYSIENSEYRVIAYSADNIVLDVDEGYIDVLLPNQELGIGGNLYPPKDMYIDHVEGQILHGKFVETEELPEFTSENVILLEDTYFPKVSGIINNPYSKDVSDLRVNAIVYNDAGEIIGGGYTYLDFILANGSAAVEVSITISGTPANSKIYATLSGLSILD